MMGEIVHNKPAKVIIHFDKIVVEDRNGAMNEYNGEPIVRIIYGSSKVIGYGKMFGFVCIEPQEVRIKELDFELLVDLSFSS